MINGIYLEISVANIHEGERGREECFSRIKINLVALGCCWNFSDMLM